MPVEAQPGLIVVGEGAGGSEAVPAAADRIETARHLVEPGGRPLGVLLPPLELHGHTAAAGAICLPLKHARPLELLAGTKADACGDAVVTPVCLAACWKPPARRWPCPSRAPALRAPGLSAQHPCANPTGVAAWSGSAYDPRQGTRQPV
ncbi:hypothetical protein [Streptomyces bluensis]|uniref:Uncharacterized protein n=1 Tax=Streptomyces bluensis TaxID=33897 RepID=A0ABW6UTK0_9ACTN